MSSSKSDLTTTSIMIMEPHQPHHDLHMNWNNKPNDLITTQDQYPSFLQDPHHLFIDPPPLETLIPFQTPPTTNLFSNQDQNQDQDQDQYQDQEEEEEEEEEEEMDAMKEMQYMIAVMQPIDIDPATVPKPNRRNVKISDDPQTVVARRRRERISEKIRILKRIVPGGAKMDTSSMLDEAIRYAKFLKRQVKLLQSPPHHHQSQIGAPMVDPTSLYYYQNS